MNADKSGCWSLVVIFLVIGGIVPLWMAKAEKEKQVRGMADLIEKSHEQAKGIQKQVERLGPYTDRAKVLEDLETLEWMLNPDTWTRD